MKRKTSLIIGIVLLVLAIVFLVYALHHPKAAFPWSNRISFLFYGIYFWLLFKFLLVPLLSKTGDTTSKESLLQSVIWLFASVVFFLMEITENSVGFSTILRGFIIIGGLNEGISFLHRWIRLNKA